MSASREKKLRAEQREQGHGSSARDKRMRQQSFRRAVASIIAATICLGLVALFIIGTGVIPANIAALTVDGVKITPAELNYHYISAYQYEYNYGYLQYYSSYGDVSDPFALDSVAYYDTMSWKDYLLESAKSSAKIAVAQSEQAKKEGIELTQEDRDQIADSLAYIEETAAASNVSVKKLLEGSYGRGMTLKGYEKAMERSLLSQAYARHVYDGYERSDAELEQYYGEHRENYEFATYHLHSFTRTLSAAEGEEEPSDEDKAAFEAEQKAKAEEMLSLVTDPASFAPLADTYIYGTDGAEAEEETEEETAEEDENTDAETGEETGTGEEGIDAEEEPEEEPTDDTLKENIKCSDISDEALKEYIMDSSRKEGDKTIIETDSEFMVVLFVSRVRHEYETVNVRHVLISSDGTTAEAAHEEAMVLLGDWKIAEGNEDSFAEMANEHSTDTGSNTNGGLYENVYKGQMVDTFDAWCFDESRQPGDTGLVDTTYGTHIMYFVSKGEVYWKYMVRTDMDDEAFNEKQTALVEALTVKENSFGMSFVA